MEIKSGVWTMDPKLREGEGGRSGGKEGEREREFK